MKLIKPIKHTTLISSAVDETSLFFFIQIKVVIENISKGHLSVLHFERNLKSKKTEVKLKKRGKEWKNGNEKIFSYTPLFSNNNIINY